MAHPRLEDLAGAPRKEVLRASPRMFESDLLDKVSRVHPSVPLFIFVPAIIVFAWAGFARLPIAEAIAWMAGGYLFWTLTEYWLHRIVFHFEPREGIGARLHWIIHGVHHDHPNDPMRLVMPPSLSVPLAALFYGLFVLVVGGGAAFAVAAGFFAGYLFYDMTHYHVHHHRPAHGSATSCASCTCATTSRTTRAGSASALRSGTTCSARRPTGSRVGPRSGRGPAAVASTPRRRSGRR